MPKKFFNLLNNLIDKHNFEKQTLAERLGVTAAYISILTSQRGKPPEVKMVSHICDILKCSSREKRELIFLAIKERAPDVVEYLLSPEGIGMLKKDTGGILPFLPGPGTDKSLRTKITNVPLHKLLQGFFASPKVPIHHKKIAILFLKEELALYEPEIVAEIKDIDSIYPEKK